MRVDLRLPWAVLCLCAFSAAARAGGEREVTVAEDVTVRLRWPWPDMLNHGSQPIFVELENKGNFERELEMRLSLYASDESGLIEKTVRLAPHLSTRFEICAPTHAQGSAPYAISLRSGTEREYVQGVGASLPAEFGVRNVLVLSRDPLDPGMPATFAKRLSAHAPAEWAVAPVPDPIQVSTSLVRRARTVAVPTTTSTEMVRVTQVLFADLPRNPACYSSIDALVIDTGAGLPEADISAAIASYARCGGLVVFAGRSESVRASPEFAAWLEPRFQAAESAEGLDAFICGQGLLALAPRDVFELDTHDAGLMRLLGAKNGDLSLVPRIGGGRGQSLDVELPDLELPYRALMCVLLLFAIVIGPVNLWFVKRSKKPVLLLFTVPLIAIVFSLALFAYGALAQGLDVRARRATLTLLDQRTHRSTSLETREIFAGLAVGRGLKPGPGAWLYAQPTLGSWSDRKNFRIDLSDGVEFGGDYLPARSPTRQTLITDRAARQRVDFRREGETYRAQFALGAEARRFLFRAPDGRLFRSPDAVLDGASVLLEPLAGAVDAGPVAHILGVEPRDAEFGLLPGSYFAVLSGSVFNDAMGVDARDVESEHSLVGIVDPSEVNR